MTRHRQSSPLSRPDVSQSIAKAVAVVRHAEFRSSCASEQLLRADATVRRVRTFLELAAQRYPTLPAAVAVADDGPAAAAGIIRVLLADDHETVRHGLRLLLERQDDMQVVGEVGSGRLAVEQAAALHPTVVVLDISMADGNGVEAARAISETSAGIGIVALSRYSEDGYVQAMLSAGAAAYVLKQSSSTELLHAIRSVADGRRYLDGALTDRVTSAFLARHTTGEQLKPITDRERQVLRLIAIGYSNKEIAQQLDLSVKTVEVHKANAIHKLGLRGRVEIVRYALREGWLHDA